MRRVVVTGTNSTTPGTITVSWRENGVVKGQLSFTVIANADFDLDVAIQLTGKRFDATIAGNCDAQIQGITWQSEPRPAGVVVPV